jgi:hypothetical protein
LSNGRASIEFSLSRPDRIKRALLGGAGVFGLSLALAITAMPAAAKSTSRYKLAHKQAERLSREPFGDIPKGPVQIFISINQQKLYLYSDGTLIADSSVATGVPSLPTPLGVFSVIQKQRFHRSNIYSNAPMPFMQRITWSGVAIHEGEGIGHRASHGCVRMPHDFAVRLYRLTQLGARVIIARNELKPVEFADPHLFVHKDMTTAPAVATAGPAKTAQNSDNSKTSDVAGPMAADAAAKAAKPDAGQVSAGADGAVNSAAASATVKSPTAPSADHSPIAASTAATGPANASATASQNPQLRSATADVAAPAPSPAPPVSSAAPADTSKIDGSQVAAGVATVATPAADPDEITPLPLAKPASLDESGAASHAPIAIFVSRKTKRIYVRQDFTPLFDAPITIADPDQPIGTHVFTALGNLPDGTTFRWNVVSVPDAPKATRKFEYERHGKVRRRIEVLEKTPVDQSAETPEQVLARIEIPQDVIDQISQLMVPGSSLVVSDEGLGPETGQGTDFIVITH